MVISLSSLFARERLCTRGLGGKHLRRGGGDGDNMTLSVMIVQYACVWASGTGNNGDGSAMDHTVEPFRRSRQQANTCFSGLKRTRSLNIVALNAHEHVEYFAHVFHNTHRNHPHHYHAQCALTMCLCVCFCVCCVTSIVSYINTTPSAELTNKCGS